MFAAWMLLTFGLQEPQPSPPKPESPPAEVKTPAAGQAAAPARSLTDAEAKQAVADFEKSLAGKASMAQKVRALDALADATHKQLVKPLGKVVEADASVVVRKRAAELLARQPEDPARSELLRLLRHSRVQDSLPVVAALVTGLATCGYRKSDWKTVGDLFAVDYAPERVAVQEAVLRLAAAHKEAQALDLLLDNLDEPLPKNVDAPDNPPAEYWEARWKAWRVWQSHIKDALFALTGQRFSTTSEAKAWLRKNPLK